MLAKVVYFFLVALISVLVAVICTFTIVVLRKPTKKSLARIRTGIRKNKIFNRSIDNDNKPIMKNKGKLVFIEDMWLKTYFHKIGHKLIRRIEVESALFGFVLHAYFLVFRIFERFITNFTATSFCSAKRYISFNKLKSILGFPSSFDKTKRYNRIMLSNYSVK